MRFLFRLSIGLSFWFLAVILAMRLFAGMTPPRMSELFTNPDGSACQLPCLFGVRPGEMSVNDALKILHEHPLTQYLDEIPLENGMALGSEGVMLIVYSQDGTNISFLNLRRDWSKLPGIILPPSAPRLLTAIDSASTGEVFTCLGQPAGFEFEDRNSEWVIWMFYPDKLLTIASTTDRNSNRLQAYLDMNGAMQNLFVYPTNRLTQYPSIGIKPWLGFTTVERYRQPSVRR